MGEREGFPFAGEAGTLPIVLHDEERRSMAVGGIRDEEDTPREPFKELSVSEGQERERLSFLIGQVFDPTREKRTFGELMRELDHHGIALVLIVFSLPSALPVPAPGYSTLLSIPLLFIGVGLLRGQRAIAFPEFFAKRTFDPAKLSKVRGAMQRLALFLERFSRPRWEGLVRSPLSRFSIGVLICLLGLSMAIPIPGTNTLPAGGIFLIGFSFLEDDALFLAIGVLWSVVALCFTTLVIVLGAEAAKFLVKNLLGMA